jgi:hypothetical protein
LLTSRNFQPRKVRKFISLEHKSRSWSWKLFSAPQETSEVCNKNPDSEAGNCFLRPKKLPAKHGKDKVPYKKFPAIH